ncbi:secretion protein [Trinickia sp. EG282A]|uniref:secretion protein n=1 Tax=Trinickia sp. EG282A TaxID=3237013 RepID=UPI0034D2CA55
MNLQTQRRLEQFARLAELPVIRIEPRMEFALPPFRLYVEVVNERVVMTLAARVDAKERARILKLLLSAWRPAALHGVPVRAFAVRGYQLLACSPAPGSDSGEWLTCYKAMRRILEHHAGGRA